MPTKSELADEFLRQIETRGEQLRLDRESRAIVLKSDTEQRRVSLWRLDVMIFQFLAAHAAIASVTASEVLNEVLARLG
jgi:hypothetical protein